MERLYDKEIQHYVDLYNIDANLTRSVMYVENATGHKFGFNKMADNLGLSKSKLPMNIKPELWSKWKNTVLNLEDYDDNIHAATLLLTKLSKSIENPTPEKIGTLWNNLNANTINNVGSRIGRAYREEPWSNKNEIKKLIEENNIANYIRDNSGSFLQQTLMGNYDSMFQEIRDKE